MKSKIKVKGMSTTKETNNLERRVKKLEDRVFAVQVIIALFASLITAYFILS